MGPLALSQAVHEERPLQLDGLERHVPHVRRVRGFAVRSSAVRIVLAALAGHAIQRDAVASDQSRIQAQQTPPPRYVVAPQEAFAADARADAIPLVINIEDEVRVTESSTRPACRDL